MNTIAAENNITGLRHSASLTDEERRKISVRLGAGLLGTALLILGTILLKVSPVQWQIAEILRGISALIVGTPIIISGLRGIVTGSTRRATDQLVAIAVLAAAARGDFVSATLIPLCLEIGRLFEEKSSLGAQAAIDGVRSLAARKATLWKNDVEKSVDPSTLVVGDVILVRPGERIAVDGVVLVGTAAIDQSAVTGESIHEEVGPGSPVFAGTIALDGLLQVQVKGTGAGTILGRVVTLLSELEKVTLPILRLFESRATIWLPVILVIAATTLFFTEDLSRAIAVLVVATPTALVIAGPAAMVAAMTMATRLRILIKSTDFLERSSEVDTLILDKTGTVTIGIPGISNILPKKGVTSDFLLSVAASCGFGSLHPVSKAVVAEARNQGIEINPPQEVQEHPGLGVSIFLNSKTALMGRRKFLESMNITFGDDTNNDAEGVWVALDGQYLGRLVVRDQPRAEAREALGQLRDLGINRFILLTGDKKEIAEEVGSLLGVDSVIAEVLPEQKLEVVREEQKTGRVVMMVGDGVNDALALAGADVGVAVGAEVNEVALGGADVALLGADLYRLPQLIRLADKTRQIISQNAWLAFWIASFLIVLAAFGILSPLTGALAQSLGVIVIVANSARILHFAK